MHKNEKGFASIVIALVLIIVLALFTVGFAQLSRREQQSALDNQKATQAQYAAESGINNAYQDILSGQISDSNASDTNCMKAGSGPSKLSPTNSLTAKGENINTPNGTSYSCVLVSLHTDNLQEDGLEPNTGIHMLFGTDTPLSTLTIKWGSYDGRTTYAPSLDSNKPSFKTVNNWPYPGVLELSVTPAANIRAIDPDGYLRDNTFSFYAYPSNGSVNNPISAGGKTGQVASGACSGTTSYPCSVKLTDLGGQTKYILHLVDFYDTSNIVITATDTYGNSTTFTGEPIIDVTGKARDVLKRLRVRVFTNGTTSTSPDDNSILPNNALQAQNICKRIQTAPQSTGGSSYDSLDGSCDLSN